MKRRTLIAGSAAAVLLTACGKNAEAKETIQLYKTATCACCGGWGDYMESRGYTVETHVVSDIDAVKRKHRIPTAVESCHTSVIGDYVVEGHVPVGPIERLLKERPALDAIAMPGMPQGSPGMPGRKSGTWTVYGIKNGKISVFEKI